MPIDGATGAALTLGPAQRGATITVAATVHRRGYAATAAVSAPTGPVTLGPTSLAVVAASRSARAGAKIRIHVAGLAPREPYTLRLGQRRLVAGAADGGGRIARAVRLPKRTKPGKTRSTVVGSAPDRTGSDPLRVLRRKQR